MADNGLSDEQLDKMLAAQKHERNITPITVGRTEEQIAKEIREDLQGRLEAVSEIMTRAKREYGFTINFGFSPPDSFGRVSLAVLEITKKLC